MPREMDVYFTVSYGNGSKDWSMWRSIPLCTTIYYEKLSPLCSLANTEIPLYDMKSNLKLSTPY